MSGKLTTSKASNKGWGLELKPKAVWTVVSAYIFIIIALLIAVPRLLIPLFPLGSIAIGIFFYRRYRLHYIGFVWWLWFLGTFVKRLIDYHCGYVTPWPYHMTPLLVTSISVTTFLRYLPGNYKRDGLPFALCFLAILYGFLMGLIRQPTADYDREILILLNWLSPIAFGFHLFIHWRQYPRLRQLFQQVFLWGVLVMGIYGVIQFLTAPGWDKMFLIQFSRNGYSSYMGVPEPLGIRVWSTMGNPMTFAFNILPGLLLMFVSQHRLRFVAGGIGYLVFLLAQVRTSWYTWVICMAVFFVSLKERYQIRIFVAISLLLLLIIPLTTIDPFAEIIGSRFETLSSIESDGSFQSRMGAFERGINYAMSEVIGWGLMAPGQAPMIGNSGEGLFSVMDNGYLMILVSFGWFAAIVYVMGIVLLVAKLFQIPSSDLFAVAARAIVIASLARMITSDITTEQYAMPIWSFLGIGLAACKYHSYQKNTKIAQLQFKAEELS